jgi:hypothetical protein
MFSNLRECFGDDADSDSLVAIIRKCLSLAGHVVPAPMLASCYSNGPPNCSDAWLSMGDGMRLYCVVHLLTRCAASRCSGVLGVLCVFGAGCQVASPQVCVLCDAL